MMSSASKKSMIKARRWLLSLIVALIIWAFIWGIQWATFARPPLPEAVAALESDDLVEVSKEPWLNFSPVEEAPTTGFIFYPGGRINPQGYASLMNPIAAKGYLIVIPVMPINMAIFDSDVADEIIAYYPDIDHWVIGGHSVGGTAAAIYADKNPDLIDGLAIWASYPADNSDISGTDIPVLSIYGGEELRVNDTSIGERKHLLPEDTVYIRIEGGDHHQFGAYEIEAEEHLATISRKYQHEQIIEATLEILKSISR
ncbi:MAG: alpha/beta hydrolase [Chloroflexi bacterium]|nr:alpha/beta hydrolase [Chloroflexota bacterium]